MKKFAFFDLDMTLYAGYSMVDFLFKNIIPNQRASQEQIVAAKNLFDKYSKGEISYNDATRQVIYLTGQILKSKTVAEVRGWQKNFFKLDNFFSYVKPLFSLLKE